MAVVLQSVSSTIAHTPGCCQRAGTGEACTGCDKSSDVYNLIARGLFHVYHCRSHLPLKEGKNPNQRQRNSSLTKQPFCFVILLFSGSLIGRGHSPTARVTRGAWVPVLVSRLQRCVLILCNYREVNTDLIALQTNRKQKHCVCLTQQRSAHVAQRFAAIGVGAALLRQLQGNERGGVRNHNTAAGSGISFISRCHVGATMM